MLDAKASTAEPPFAYVPNTPWPPWTALLWAAGAILASFSVAALAAVTIASQGGSQSTAIVVATLCQQIVLIIAALWMAGLKGGARRDVLALVPAKGGVVAYLMALLTLIAFVMAMSITIHAIDPTLIKNDLKPFAEILKSPVWWAMFPMVGIGAPLAEELLFRGFLFPALAKTRIGLTGAALVTSAGWAAVHSYSLVGMSQVFVIGLVFSWMLVRTGSLKVPIVVHAIYNTVLTALMVAEVGKGVLTP